MNDRITIIKDGLNSTSNKILRLDKINTDQIRQSFAVYNKSLSFSTVVKSIGDQLAKIQTDLKSKTFQHTVILTVGGEQDIFPFDELIALFKKYRSIMSNVWIISLDEDYIETLRQLNEIIHGKLLIVGNREDLHQAYLNIANISDHRSSKLTVDLPADSSTTTSNESPSSIATSTKRETFVINSTNPPDESFQQMTTDEQRQNSESVSIRCIPESLIYDQLCHISLPSRREDILPDILLTIVEQIAAAGTNMVNNILIPLPILSKRLIDYLPTIKMKLPIEQDEFNFNEFVDCFVQDIGIHRRDLFVIEAHQGSINIKIKLSMKIASDEAKLETIKEIILSMNLPVTKNFVAINIEKQRGRSRGTSLPMSEIQLALENFERTGIDRIRLTPETINHNLRMSQFMTILDQSQSRFLKEKSQYIVNCLMHACRECAFDYVLELALLICNKTLLNQYKGKYSRPRDNERVLFHGTNTNNFDGIFENNFQYNASVRHRDVGWYGKGIYFSSSLRKALNYANSERFHSVHYIICSLVAVGKSLTITNMNYRGRPMHPGYDSHYVRVSPQHGEPISDPREKFFEEFVIKQSDRILPLFIVGVRCVHHCAVWRDARITNEANSSVLDDMRRRLPLNIYTSKASDDTLEILRSKFSTEEMNCAVITNGGDNGQQFATECRQLRPNIPIVVYCKKKAHHQQWAIPLGQPEIKVTSNAEEVLEFVNDALIEN